MRCPNCSAEVSALREFCPVCQSAMDAGMRSRFQPGRAERTDTGRKSSKTPILVGAAASVLLMLGLTGQFDGFEPEIDNAPTSQNQPRGPVTIEADQLLREFRGNPGLAAEKYGEREMVVSGEFVRIVPDGYGSLDLRLKTANPEDQLGIDVTQIAIEDAKRLVPGQRVTLSCQKMGSGDETVWVQDCAIQLAGDGAQPPTAPTPAAEEPAE